MKWFLTFALLGVASVLFADIWVFDDNSYRSAANMSLIYLTILTATFTARYAGWSQWYVNRIGRNYLVFKTVMSLVLVQVCVAVWWDPEFPWRQQFRFLIYSLGAIAAVPMLHSLIREQKTDNNIRDALRHRHEDTHSDAE